MNNSYGSQSQETEDSAVTWKAFEDRNNLFSVQYPSNRLPSGVKEEMQSGPIDMLFFTPSADENSGASVEFIQ
jgi:hypothetical protein